MRLSTFLTGLLIAGLALIVWVQSELEVWNILFIVVFLPIGIWFVVASILPHKPTNEVIGDVALSTGLLELPIKIVAAIWVSAN
ncbi:MAG: hypothetical protein DBP02_13750 [gamma proteobacterium symbiont of Ctena orbiculata]|nr:MAG: hypothetical protein DBP02_13750 [gamma proteobacterium symbiont of Ctena orbiculata]